MGMKFTGTLSDFVDNQLYQLVDGMCKVYEAKIEGFDCSRISVSEVKEVDSVDDIGSDSTDSTDTTSGDSDSTSNDSTDTTGDSDST